LLAHCVYIQEADKSHQKPLEPVAMKWHQKKSRAPRALLNWQTNLPQLPLPLLYVQHTPEPPDAVQHEYLHFFCTLFFEHLPLATFFSHCVDLAKSWQAAVPR